jgi:hypothetical protein
MAEAGELQFGNRAHRPKVMDRDAYVQMKDEAKNNFKKFNHATFDQIFGGFKETNHESPFEYHKNRDYASFVKDPTYSSSSKMVSQAGLNRRTLERSFQDEEKREYSRYDERRKEFFNNEVAKRLTPNTTDSGNNASSNHEDQNYRREPSLEANSRLASNQGYQNKQMAAQYQIRDPRNLRQSSSLEYKRPAQLPPPDFRPSKGLEQQESRNGYQRITNADYLNQFSYQQAPEVAHTSSPNKQTTPSDDLR